MRRRTFDWLMSAGGVVVTVVLIVAGVLLFTGYKFANDTVAAQLSSQKIFFPPAGSEAITTLPQATAAGIDGRLSRVVVARPAPLSRPCRVGCARSSAPTPLVSGLPRIDRGVRS